MIRLLILRKPKDRCVYRVEFYPIDRLAGHIIKTEEDLRIAEALLRIRGQRSEIRGRRAPQ